MAHRVVPRNDTVFLNTLRRTIMVAMIPLVSMSLCLFLFHFWQTLTAADEANINILYKDAKIMDQTLDNLHRSLNYSAQDPSVVGFSMRPYIQDTERDIQLLAMLKNLEKSYPFIHESYLYSPHENRQLSSTGSIVSAAPEWLSRMSEASCTLPNGLLGWMGRGTAAAQDLYLAAAVPMESSDPAGYVVLRIDFGQFAQDSLELEEQDSNSATYIFSDDYGLLYSTKNAMDLSQWADEIFGISSGSSALKLLGGALLHCTTLRSEGLGWTYVYTSPAFPTSALLALLVPILVSILTAIGIGLWLAYQNSKELYRPLEQLVSALPNDLPEAVDARNEYSRLARYYDALLKQRDEVYEQVAEIKPLLLKEFLVSLAHGEAVSADEIQYQAEILELPFQETAVLACILQIDSYFKLPYTDEEKRMIRSRMIDLASAGEARGIYALATDVSDETLLVICNLLDEGLGSDALLSYMQRLKGQIETEWKLSLTMAVSETVHTAEALPAACRQARTAASYKLYRGRGCIIPYEEICQEPHQPYSMDFEKIQMLLQALRSGDSKQTAQLLQELFRDMRERRAEPEHIRAAMKHLVVALADVTCANGVSLRPDTLDALVGEFSKRKTMPDMEEWLISTYCRAADQIREYAAQRPNKSAEKIRAYIDSNFTKDISLATIADYMGYSSTYVSKIFKQTYGMSYIEYMNSKRIELSKQLLADTQLSVKEIGFRAGFNNMQTFFRVFKQCVGTTPSQYRGSTELS